METFSLKKFKKFPKIEIILREWFPLIKREFEEDEKDFGGWYYEK